jgi:hypothetical protein
MSLTKTQITIACAALALVPIGYEWHAVASARSDNERLGAQLRDLRREAVAGEKRRMETEHQIGSIEREIAKIAVNTPPPEEPAAIEPATWDELSPYVRLPRDVFSKVRFTEFGTDPAADGKFDRYPMHVLSAEGQPRPALEAALGLSNSETQQFRQVCRDAFAEFNTRLAQHSVMTHPQVPDREAVRIDFSAFPEEGAAFQQRLRERLISILGPERTEAFWQQAAPTFGEFFNDFGATPTGFQLMRRKDGPVEYLLQRQQYARIGKLEDLRGLPIPSALKPTADAWSASASLPSGGHR